MLQHSLSIHNEEVSFNLAGRVQCFAGKENGKIATSHLLSLESNNRQQFFSQTRKRDDDNIKRFFIVLWQR